MKLTELEIEHVYGPVATISWLLRTLKIENNGEDALLRSGAIVICSTPGDVYPIPPGVNVRVEFAGLETTCMATKPVVSKTSDQ